MGFREDIDCVLQFSENPQDGGDQMETDPPPNPPPNTDPGDLSKYKLDDYDNEPNKKGPYFHGLPFFRVC